MEQKDSAEQILKQIPYEIVYSARKTLAVQVKADGSVVVRAPKRMAKYKIEAFLKEKQDWILSHRERALAASEQKKANGLTEAERKAALQRAAEMLAAEREISIAEIGCSVGYDSASKFSAAFKRAMGMTPSEYRMERGTKHES